MENMRMEMMEMRMQMMEMRMGMMDMQESSESEDNAGIKESKLVGRWKITSYTIGTVDAKTKGWAEFSKKTKTHVGYEKEYYIMTQHESGSTDTIAGTWWMVIDDKLILTFPSSSLGNKNNPHSVSNDGAMIFELALDGKKLTAKSTEEVLGAAVTTTITFEKL